MEQAASPATAGTARNPRLKIIVLDDDPTGSQTLHSCPLLLRWDPASLRRGLSHPSPFLFLLANTRALEPGAARARVREICAALWPALAEARLAGDLDHWLIVSRGDSTLRGHTPLEVETIAAELAAGEAPQHPRVHPAADDAGDPAAGRDSLAGRNDSTASGGGAAAAPAGLHPAAPTRDTGRDGDGETPGPLAGGSIDAVLLVPAFLPGGRTTRDGVHLLQGTPVHTTAFARDRLFGYSTSHLPDWLAEKSGGRIAAAGVQRLTLAELEAAAAELQAGRPIGGAAGFGALCRRLADLEDGTWLAVDAERPEQLAALGAAVRELTAPAAAGRWGRPRQFLFQSAASLLNGLADIGPQPRPPQALASLRRRTAGAGLPGLVLVGSHVPLADRQLERLLADPRCRGVELSVPRLQRLLEGPLPDQLLASLEAAWLEQLQQVLASGSTPVLYTSRGEVSCAQPQERIALGLALAALTARLAATLAPRLGYLISKGGITTHTLLADGLQLASVELQGQLLPGLSLVLTGPEATVPGLPVLTFPGNLGDAETLAMAWQLMEGG